MTVIVEATMSLTRFHDQNHWHSDIHSFLEPSHCRYHRRCDHNFFYEQRQCRHCRDSNKSFCDFIVTIVVTIFVIYVANVTFIIALIMIDIYAVNIWIATVFPSVKENHDDIYRHYRRYCTYFVETRLLELGIANLRNWRYYGDWTKVP
jgi:hypothetical protein